MAGTSTSVVRNSYAISCNVIKSMGLRMIPKWRPPIYALDSCLLWINAPFSPLQQARTIVTYAKR